MTLTTDPHDPRLGHGSDEKPRPQNPVYLVLSEEERAKGFVRPVRRTYVHRFMRDGSPVPPVIVQSDLKNMGGCGAATTMGQALAETYARDPQFYGSTYCVGCQLHRPVGPDGEFVWEDGSKVGT